MPNPYQKLDADLTAWQTIASALVAMTGRWPIQRTALVIDETYVEVRMTVNGRSYGERLELSKADPYCPTQRLDMLVRQIIRAVARHEGKAGAMPKVY